MTASTPASGEQSSRVSSIPFTHCRRGSIPQIDGAQEPLGIHDHLVRLDNGTVVAIDQDRLTKRLEEDHPLTGVA